MKDREPLKGPEHIPQPGEFLPPILTIHKHGKKKEMSAEQVDEFDWMVAFRRKQQ